MRRSSGTPQLAEMRRLPEFMAYLREIGMVDYWKEYGWPDICHPLGENDFECDEPQRNEANDESR